MKNRFLVVLLTLLTAGALTVKYVCDPDPSIAGSHSHMFHYDISFHPQDETQSACFVVVLSNVTNVDLRISCYDKDFRATLEVEDGDGGRVKVYHEVHGGPNLTVMLAASDILLCGGDTVTWLLPLSSLITEHGEPISYEYLAGKKVFSVMEIGVIYKYRESLGDNALQKSNVISIPNKG